MAYTPRLCTDCPLAALGLEPNLPAAAHAASHQQVPSEPAQKLEASV